MFAIPEIYFLAVADTKNFSRASEKLFVSQPAVSKQISILEEELGFSLFERTTRMVRLTPKGKIIYKAIKDAQKIWDEAINLARSIKEHIQGHLRIGLLYGWSMSRLNTTAFGTFQQKYPDVELVIEKHTYREMTAMLLNGSLDLIFCPKGEVSNIPNIRYCHAFKTPLIVLLSSTHPVAAYAKTLDDFAGMDILAMNWEASLITGTLVEQLISENKWKFQIRTYPNFESILVAVERHQGCAITCLCSGACESSNFKYYLTEADLQIECAWNIETLKSAALAFLSEVDLNFSANCT